MQLLEDKGGRPDRNEVDTRVGPGKICLIYGFRPEQVGAFSMNGLQCLVEGEVKRVGNMFFPPNEVWYACSVYGVKHVVHLRDDHLTVIDDLDTIAIEKMMIKK